MVIVISDFIAGLFAGWAQVIVGQPLDLIKTHIQMTKQNISVQQIIRKIRQQNGLGIKGFYKGASSMFIGTGFTLSYEFGLYEGIKQLFRVFINSNDQQLIPIYQIGISGGIVGFMGSLIYTPTEYCKIQIQIKSQLYKTNTSAYDILVKHIKQLNIKPIYKGFLACFSRQVLGTSIYFSTYESIIRYYLNQGEKSHINSRNVHIILAGGAAGIFFWLASYPLDNIKTLIQSNQSNSIIDSWKQLKSNKTIFRGLEIALLRSIPINAATFFVFQNMQKILRSYQKYLRY